MRVSRSMAGWALSAVFGVLSASAAAAPSYDMRGLLAEPHPLAPVAPAAPAAPPQPHRFEPAEDPTLHFNRLYDMRLLLVRPHPLAPTMVPRALPPAPVIPTLPPPVTPAAPVPRVTARPPAPTAAPAETADAAIDDVADDSVDTNDPLESFNRVIFEFNEFVLEYMLGPVTDAYRFVVPDFAEQAVSNAFDNLGEPVTLVNDVLQAEPRRAWNTTARFLINTIAGLGGTINVAEQIGIESHEEDFGQTMAVWGVGEGMYLVLPLLGPSNPRDAIGKHLVDSFFDPFSLWLDEDGMETVRYGLTALKAVDAYSGVKDDLEKVKKTSVDYYGALRSLFRQKRRTEIRNAKGVEVPDLDFDIDEGDLDSLN